MTSFSLRFNQFNNLIGHRFHYDNALIIIDNGFVVISIGVETGGVHGVEKSQEARRQGEDTSREATS